MRRDGFLNRPRIKVDCHEFELRCSCDKGDLIHKKQNNYNKMLINNNSLTDYANDLIPINFLY